MNIIPKHKLLVISINKSISEGSEIYDAVRWAWKLNPERAKECEFVLAQPIFQKKLAIKNTLKSTNIM